MRAIVLAPLRVLVVPALLVAGANACTAKSPTPSPSPLPGSANTAAVSATKSGDSAASSSTSTVGPVGTSTGSESHEAARSVAQLLADAPPAATAVHGFVIVSYFCPPCPPGAMCKPCVGDHVVLADRADARPNDGVRIFVSDPLSFKVGTHYRFIVEGRGPSHPSEYFGTIAPDAAPP